MKILALNWQDIKNPIGGGAEVHFQEIFKRIVKMGHEVDLFCCSHPDLPDEEIIDGIRVVRRGNRNTFNFMVPFTIKKIFNIKEYDIIVDDINKIPLFTPLYIDKPVLAIVHHLFKKSIFQQAHFLPASYVYLSELLIGKIYKNVQFTVVSQSSKEELMNEGIPEQNIRIIYNCVDHDIYNPGEMKKEENVVGYLGRIKKYKRVDVLINAIDIVKNSIPEVKLQILGDGDYLPVLKKMVKDKGLEKHIEFLGFADSKKKVEILRKCPLVLNPSSKEGWGLTVIESNACGTPVIASNVPGLKDSVIHNKTGLLFEFGNSQGLADNIVSTLKNKPLLEELTRNALEWAQSFNWDNSAREMLSLMENII